MLKKAFFCVFLGFCVIFSDAYADNDCRLITPGFILTENSFAQLSAIYPKADIQVAMDHLTYFCCENGYTEAEYCPPQKEDGTLLEKKLYAQSPYLFDQLVDIGMRRLDGEPKSQYQGAGVDEQGRVWRKWIQTAAELTNGLIPATVINQYKDSWKTEVSQNPAFPTNNITQLSKERKGYGLKNKYFAMCYVVDYIEASLNPQMTVYEDVQIKTQTQKCFGLVDELIQQEFAYMKRVMIQQGARLVSHNMSTYTDDYFTRGRLQPVLAKFANMQATFLMVNQKVNEGTNQCTAK